MTDSKKLRLARITKIDGKTTVVIEKDEPTTEMFSLSKKISKKRKDFDKIEEMFLMVLSDIAEFNQEVNTIRKGNQQKTNRTAQDLNRKLTHILSSGRLFVDFIENQVKSKYGKDSSAYIDTKNIIRNIYDNYFSYRLYYYLRNFTQHIGFVITTISRSLINPIDVNDFSAKVNIYISLDYLLNSNFDWKRALKKELITHAKKSYNLNVLTLNHEYHEAISMMYLKFNELYLELNHQELLDLKFQSDVIYKKYYDNEKNVNSRYGYITFEDGDDMKTIENKKMSILFSGSEIDKIYVMLSKIGLVRLNLIM